MTWESNHFPFFLRMVNQQMASAALGGAEESIKLLLTFNVQASHPWQTPQPWQNRTLTHNLLVKVLI